MSSYQLSLPSQVVHVALSPSEDALAVLLSTGLVQVWDLHTSLPEGGVSRLRAGGKVSDPKILWERSLAPSQSQFVPKQVSLGGDGSVAALFWGDGDDGAVLRTADANDTGTASVLACSVWVLWEAEVGWLVVDRDGMLRSRKFPLLPRCRDQG